MFVDQISLSAKRLSCGFSQVMLQESRITGLLFILGIGLNSWLMLLCAVVGSCSSTLAAMLYRADAEDLDRGLYGYNGALVGLAVSFYLPLSFWSVIILIACSMLSTVIQRLLVSVRVAPLTGPFVIAGWLALSLAQLFDLNGRVLPIVGNDLALTVLVDELLSQGVIQAISHGLGQVMFQGNTVTGVLFVTGLAVAAPKAALWGVAGSMLGLLVAVLMQYPEPQVYAGLFGFNAVLVAITLAGRFDQFKLYKSVLLVVAGIILSVLITRSFQLFGTVPLTAPFVLTCWLFYLLGYLSRKRLKPESTVG